MNDMKIKASDFSVMSYNIYYNNTEKSRVISLIKNYSPDTLSVQEATPEWMRELVLKENLGGTYSCVGVGRNGNGKGEYCAIFYKTDLFSLIDEGTVWLSDTPTVISKFPISDHNRIMTYAALEHKNTGERFIQCNVHPEYKPIKEKQLEIFLERVELLKNEFLLPIVLTGDFNTRRSEKIYERIIQNGFNDSFATAKESDNKPTFISEGIVIDYIFGEKNTVEFSEYRVIDDKVDGKYPSDHCPVFARFKFKN